MDKSAEAFVLAYLQKNGHTDAIAAMKSKKSGGRQDKDESLPSLTITEARDMSTEALVLMELKVITCNGQGVVCVGDARRAIRGMETHHPWHHLTSLTRPEMDAKHILTITSSPYFFYPPYIHTPSGGRVRGVHGRVR